MTPTQIELLNSIDFWRKRRDDQLEYIKSVLNLVKAKQENALRKVEICLSAREVLNNIERQIRDLKT